MKASELRQKSIDDLQKELLALRREQFNMRMQAGAGQPPRPDQYGKVRKNLARIKTVLNELRASGKPAANKSK